jgi:uroporphyrinogen-III decarboxylase
LPSGEPIALNNAKDFYTKKSYSFSIAGLYRKKDNVKIIAFIANDSKNVKDMESLNAQQVSLDEVKKWD